MVYQKELKNGIKVVLDHMDSIRSVSIGVWVKAGSASENESNNGIAHMLEHMFFKGTKSRTAKRLADDMARIGGDMNAFTSKECTAFYAITIDSHLATAIEILADMLLHSNFDRKDLEKEKEVVLEEIDMYEDSADDLVHEMLQNVIWKDHPLGYIISGRKENVSHFTRDQLIAFWKENYVAENIVISIAGNFDPQTTLTLLEEYFGLIAKQQQVPTSVIPVFHRTKFLKKMDIEQIHMNIAYECIDYHHKDKYIFTLTNAVLGGNDNSRLFQKIREEKGLTYSIYSYASNFAQAGLFHIDAVLNPSKKNAVYEGILEVIQEMKDHGITEEELDLAKEQIKIELMINEESTKNRMNQYGKQMLYFGEITSLEETIEQIDKVTIDQIKQFIITYCCEERSSIALVGNISDDF